MRNFMLMLVIVPVFGFAQSKVGNLTVFSEGAGKFYLVLNGERQNQKPQSNIRIEELSQPVYSAKIIFENPSMPSIIKNLQVADMNDQMMDVAYRIRKDRNGKSKLTAYSATDVVKQYTVPQGMYVRRYRGKNDRRQRHNRQPDTRQAISENNCRGWAMKAADFLLAKETVAEASFEETRLSTAKSIASANCLSSEQVSSMCKLFSFEDSKLEFAKFAYRYTIDPKNYFKVNNVFSFDTSKEELNRFASIK